MKLTEIHVDGFGVWRDLTMGQLPPGVTVVYGPNEAGKTTLMHFLRSMLYGVTPERRERYLPPREGGRPGGWLGVSTDDGPFRAARHVERGDDDSGRVLITLPDGEEQGDRLLREALEAVDERTFCNVFAIGLDEINELGALEGAEAARWIYRLTSGLDRVSLYDLIQGLRNSRHHLLDAAGRQSVIGDLLEKRDRLQNQIEELSIDARRWSKLAVELDEVDAQSEQLQDELKGVERRARRVEIALGLKPLWTERLRVQDERLRYDGLPDLGERPLARLDDLNAKAEEHQRRHDTLRGQRRELHQEMRDLGVNEALMRSGCRLDALAEQEDWLAALEQQSGELGEEVERLESRIETETARLAKLWRHKPSPEAAPELDDETLELINPASDAVRDAERMVAEAKRELDSLRGHERDYDAQLETALTSSEKLGLPNDIEEASDLVAALRRRMKAEKKVEQAERSTRDLNETRDRLVESQVVTPEVFLLMTAVFAVAAVLFFSQWIWPDAQGWLWIVGLLGGGLCWVIKNQVEEHRARELDACEEQLQVADRQITQARDELRELDAELPTSEGSASIRLQHAEKHLEELERMLPVEAERRKANQRTKSADDFYRTAKEDLAAAQKEWRSTLQSVGLPDETTAAEVGKLASQYRSLAELRSRCEVKQEDAERCERDYEKLSKRIVALAEEADLVLEEAELSEQLEHLLSERRLQQGRIDHRKKLRERSRELKVQQRRHAGLAERVEADRQRLFEQAAVDGEQAFRQVVADIEAAAKLDESLARLTREIAAAIGTSGSEADYAELMSRDSLLKLDGAWSEITAEHETLEKQLRDLAARRAVLGKEREAIVEDTSLADKRIEIDLVESQLAKAQEQWRERAAVGAMLELIRSDYEQHRQPETLVEASRYFERLTRGRYERVWTPLADDVLLVDTADGESLPVESLSRGTREQLFLAVRLALVATFARRGVRLPMILDDVLVNFDDGRARVAAEVLTDFAAEGHQLIVFTCHEHVRSMFAELDVDVRRLPSRYDEPEPELELPEPEPEPIEEPVAVITPEPEPPVEAVVEPPAPVEPPPRPLPAYVEAEYLPLEPVTEVRRVVVKEPQPTIEAPTVAPEPAPVDFAIAEVATEVAYGSVTPAENEIAYGVEPPAVLPAYDVSHPDALLGATPLAAEANGYSEEGAESLDEADAAWSEAVSQRA